MIQSIIFTILLLLILFLIDYILISPYLQASQFKKKYKNQVHVDVIPFLGMWKEFLFYIKRGQFPFEGFRQVYLKNEEVKLRYVQGIKNSPFISVTDQQLQKQIFNNESLYKKKDNMMLQDSASQNHNLVRSTGVSWKKQRQMFSEFFHFQNISNMIPYIQDVINEQMKNIQQKNPFKVCQFGETVTGNIVIETFFGQELKKEWYGKIPIEQEQRQLLQYMYDRPRFSIYYKIRQMIFGKEFYKKDMLLTKEELSVKQRYQKFQTFCEKFINESIERYKNSSKDEKKNVKSFMELLVEKFVEGKIIKEQIFSNFIFFFFAGTDTTGNFAGISLYYLAKNPKVQNKLLQEIRKFDNGNTEEFNKNVMNMPYLNNFIKEVFRFYSPAPSILLREVVKDHYLGDILIKKGWNLFAPLSFDLQNPKIIPDHDKFEPDRWDSPELKNRSNTYTYIPFSAGQRNCIGQQLALIESKLIIVNILKQYEIEQIEGKQFEYTAKLTLTAKDDELVKLIKRN